MRMSLDLIDTANNGRYFTISSSKRTSQVLVNHKVKYGDTYHLIFFHKIHIKGKEIVLFVKKSNHQRSCKEKSLLFGQFKYFIDAVLSQFEIIFIHFLGGKTRVFETIFAKFATILFVFHFPAITLVTLNKPWNLIGCFVFSEALSQEGKMMRFTAKKGCNSSINRTNQSQSDYRDHQ